MKYAENYTVVSFHKTVDQFSLAIVENIISVDYILSSKYFVENVLFNTIHLHYSGILHSMEFSTKSLELKFSTDIVENRWIDSKVTHIRFQIKNIGIFTPKIAEIKMWHLCEFLYTV